MAQSSATASFDSHVSGRTREHGMRGPILASILGPIAWLSLTLLYVGFWAQGFSLFQSIILILVSILILGGVVGGAWAAWGMGHRDRFVEWSKEA